MLKQVAKAIIPSPVKRAIRKGQAWLNQPKPKPARVYQGVSTIHSTAAMHTGRFGKVYEQHWRLDPYNEPTSGDRTRMRIYNLCLLIEDALRAEGDIVTAGVAWGVAQRTLYDYLSLHSRDCTLHMIDPFLGVDNAENKAKLEKYNADEAFVRNQYPANARIRIERAFIPDCLPLPGVASACAVYLNTGDYQSEARSIASLWPIIPTGGAF